MDKSREILISRPEGKEEKEMAYSMYLELMKMYGDNADDAGVDDKIIKTYTLQNARAESTKGNRICQIIKAKDNIAGVVVHSIEPSQVYGTACFIHALYIDEKYRGNGIGTKVIKMFERKYPRYSIELNCKYRMQVEPFYRKLGFVPINISYHRPATNNI